MTEIKTSQNISTALKRAISDENIDQSAMSEDLGISPKTTSAYRTGRRDATPENSVKMADYLHNARFNSQAAAKFYNTLAECSTTEWASMFQNDAFATWYEQLRIEDQRRKLEPIVHHILINPVGQQTDKEKAVLAQWVKLLLRCISLASLDAMQTCDAAGLDLVAMTKSVNESDEHFESEEE